MATASPAASLARRVVALPDGYRVLAFDSITFLDAFYKGTEPSGRDIIVNGSYAGVFCAKIVAAFRPRAAIGLDCGIGKDGAGIAGLWYYEALGIPAAAVDVMSALMGDGLDVYVNGRISRFNQLAEDSGVRAGMPVAEAALLMSRDIAPVAGVRTNRLVVKTNTAGRSIVCTDGLAYALPEDTGRNVLCTGAHTGLSVVVYLKKFRPWGFINSDGGMGKDASGIAGMAELDALGLPGASVSTQSARLGDGRSTYFDGIISAVNALGAAKGVRVNQTAIEAADRLLDV
jgi:hypothetical protein